MKFGGQYGKSRFDKPQFGDRPNSDRPNSDRPGSDRRSTGDRGRPREDRFRGDRPREDRPREDRPREDRPRFERSDDRPGKRRHQHPERPDRQAAEQAAEVESSVVDDDIAVEAEAVELAEGVAPEADEQVEPEANERPERRPADDRDGGKGPLVPEGAEISALDPEIRRELRSLPKGLAEIVGRHLAATGMLLDEDPAAALKHAQYARLKAARVAVVREAVGLAAYHAGEWAEALSELRAARRMSNAPGHIAVMADCERALGRPERAIELAKEGIAAGTLDADEVVELRIVSAGARRDLGELDAAVIGLQGPDLDPKRRDPWSARLFYAYADNLAAAGRAEEAVRWFLNAADADDDGDTDAAERAVELGAELRDESPVKAEVAELEAELEAIAADEADGTELDTVNPDDADEPRTGEVDDSEHPAG